MTAVQLGKRADFTYGNPGKNSPVYDFVIANQQNSQGKIVAFDVNAPIKPAAYKYNFYKIYPIYTKHQQQQYRTPFDPNAKADIKLWKWTPTKKGKKKQRMIIIILFNCIFF